MVVSATLYSLGGPTIAHRLVDHYEMDPSTDKYHVVGVGCASAVPLVRLASQTLSEHPGKKALVVAAESMAGILMGASADDTRSKTVGSSIFGDGCAAALIEFDERPARRARVPSILASKVHQIGGTLGAVRMQLAPDDSYLHLARELPDIAGEGLGELVDDFLGSTGIDRGAIDHWLVHPGGRRIIESVQEALGSHASRWRELRGAGRARQRRHAVDLLRDEAHARPPRAAAGAWADGHRRPGCTVGPDAPAVVSDRFAVVELDDLGGLGRRGQAQAAQHALVEVALHELERPPSAWAKIPPGRLR